MAETLFKMPQVLKIIHRQAVTAQTPQHPVLCGPPTACSVLPGCLCFPVHPPNSLSPPHPKTGPVQHARALLRQPSLAQAVAAQPEALSCCHHRADSVPQLSHVTSTPSCIRSPPCDDSSSLPKAEVPTCHQPAGKQRQLRGRGTATLLQPPLQGYPPRSAGRPPRSTPRLVLRARAASSTGGSPAPVPVHTEGPTAVPPSCQHSCSSVEASERPRDNPSLQHLPRHPQAGSAFSTGTASGSSHQRAATRRHPLPSAPLLPPGWATRWPPAWCTE